MAQEYHDEKTITGPLSRLAAELIVRGYHAVLADPARRPRLCVANPEVPVRASVITAAAGWYWWPDARRITAITDAARAALLVIHVLHLGCDCHE
jgi:hypothetical protein